MKFNIVGITFAQIEREPSRLAMTQMLAQLLKTASAQEAEIICNLSLGQLHPPYIGTQFGMADKQVAKAVALVLGLGDDQIIEKSKELGDLGSILLQVNRSGQGDLTLLQVYDSLCALEELGGTGSQELKVRMLADLLKQLDSVSACFVVRIVIGKLRLGFSDMTLVDALSWMEAGDKSQRLIIEHAYNICADIGLIAKTLKQGGIQALQDMAIHIGVPIRPAAAERMPTAKDIFQKLGPCLAQPKLDGFRLQIHIDKRSPEPKIHFFSRNLQDMSDMFPDLKKAALALPVQTLIAEGEAIVFDPHTGIFAPFQETVKRKRKHDIEAVMEELPLQLSIFDLLYLNGQSYLDIGHEDRRKKLEQILPSGSDELIRLTGEEKIESAAQLEDYFNAAISAGLEGLVVKRPDAIYQPGKRNFNWIKLKRQEEGHLEDTIDCIILGYYSGSGKRAGFGIGAFLVGVYNPLEDRFETIAKIGTGLKDYDWKELKERADTMRISEQAKNVKCPKELIPDVWINPEIVCMIRADEITLSPVHTAGKVINKLGYALRFPRFMGYRPDKGPEEVTTVAEVEKLYSDQFARRN